MRGEDVTGRILELVLSTIPLYDEGEVFRSPHNCFGEHLTAVRA